MVIKKVRIPHFCWIDFHSITHQASTGALNPAHLGDRLKETFTWLLSSLLLNKLCLCQLGSSFHFYGWHMLIVDTFRFWHHQPSSHFVPILPALNPRLLGLDAPLNSTIATQVTIDPPEKATLGVPYGPKHSPPERLWTINDGGFLKLVVPQKWQSTKSREQVCQKAMVLAILISFFETHI